MIEIRDINPNTDYSIVARLLSLNSSYKISISSIIEEDKRIIEGKVRIRKVLLNNQIIAGYYQLIHYSSEPIGLYHFELVIDPNQRGKGLGSLLYGDLEKECKKENVKRLLGNARDTCEICHKFLIKRNFIKIYDVYDSKLNLSEFEENIFQFPIPKGISIFPFSELRENNAEADKMLYELNKITGLDEPGEEGNFPTFDNWKKIVLHSSWFKIESEFIALSEGEKFVGLCGVFPSDEVEGLWYHGLTGVLREFRNKNIATALKIHAITYAKKKQGKFIETSNDSRNIPMLRINTKLGFKRTIGYYKFEKFT